MMMMMVTMMTIMKKMVMTAKSNLAVERKRIKSLKGMLNIHIYDKPGDDGVVQCEIMCGG